jgi:exopolyphosphatase/guanosine-5'-triphosphate,3'-diphosphate pyrophosphatase
LLEFNRLDEVRFNGLSDNRCHLLATGLAIALALFDTLGIERMTPASAALREGVVEELWRAHRGGVRARQRAS